MSGETHIISIIGTGNEAQKIQEAVEREGWSAHQFNSFEELPPREKLDPELIIFTSSMFGAAIEQNKDNPFGKNVVWSTPSDGWRDLGRHQLCHAISNDASCEEIACRLRGILADMHEEILNSLGLPTGSNGEALWDLLPGTDWVTGLDNRIRFLQELQKNISRAKRYRRPFCCLLVRFNNYSSLKEELPSDTVEELLEEIAALLDVSIRDVDVLASVESDLFGLLLPETDVADSEIVIRRIQENLNNFQFSQTLPEKPNFSIGMSTFDSEAASLDSLLAQAREDLHT